MVVRRVARVLVAAPAFATSRDLNSQGQGAVVQAHICSSFSKSTTRIRPFRDRTYVDDCRGQGDELSMTLNPGEERRVAALHMSRIKVSHLPNQKADEIRVRAGSQASMEILPLLSWIFTGLGRNVKIQNDGVPGLGF